MVIDQDKSKQQKASQSNEDFLSSILTEFYGNVKQTNRSRFIKIKRITNPEESMNKDVSTVKQKLKGFSNQLHQERKEKRQQRFNKNRNFSVINGENNEDGESSKPSIDSSFEKDK